MKKFLVLLLIAACSAERTSSHLGASDLVVTISDEYTSDIKKLPNSRLAKNINGTSNFESDHQSYVTQLPKEYYSSTEQPGHRFSYVERKPSSQQYLLPADDRNTFNVIPQQENKVFNQHFLPPLNNEVAQKYVAPQQLSVQYLPPNQYNAPTVQYIPEHNQFIQQNDQQMVQQPNPYFNVYEPRPPSENRFPSQYLLPASANSLDNRFSHYYNPIDLHKVNQNPYNTNTERNPKETMNPIADRRYDASTPQYTNNQIYQEVTTPTYYSTHDPQNLQNQTNTYYNQFNNNQAYETTTQSVVEIGQSKNYPKWMNYSPSFVNRQKELNPTTTSSPLRQPPSYGEKINYQQPFALARSSNVQITPTEQAQLPEKREDVLEHGTRYVPQLPSQFKPSPRIPQTLNLRQFPQFPEQQPQASYQQPYRPSSTTEPMPVLKQTAEMDIDGSFSYETLTGDQTHIMQEGHIENRGTDHEEQVMQGSYSFIGDDGITYSVSYIADANGFRAVGDHLPTSPPIPEVIQRSIDVNMAEEAAQAQEAQLPQGYQYPQKNTNNRYPVVEQARERSSSLPVYYYNPSYNNDIKY